MSSTKCAERLAIRVRRSRSLALYLALLHLTVAGVLMLSLAGTGGGALAVSLVALSACWHWRTFPMARGCRRIARLSLTGDGAWCLESTAGQRLYVGENPSYFIGLGMILMVWPGTGWPPLRLVLFSDSASSEAMRGLRVALAA